MNAPTVKLGQLEETLVAPTPTQACALLNKSKVTDDENTTLIRTVAALGMTWPRSSWPAGSRPEPWKLGRSVLDYGAEVFDCLVGAGHTPSDVWDAAGEAFRWALSILPSEPEVKAAEDFSAAPTGG